MTTAALLLLACLGAGEPADTLVVCPAEMRAAFEPWIEYRQGQGHRVSVTSNRHTEEELRREIRRLAPQGLRYLVLVGDADPRSGQDPAMRARCVPTHYVRAVVNVQFGSEPTIATDNWFADVDDDRVPELAVGRLPADSPAELSAMVQKIIAFETSTDFGTWRRDVHFVAGLGGWGVLADTVLEAAAKSLITEGVPAPFATTMTYASWQSPYCPDPRAFASETLEQLHAGGLFWIYIGHGNVRELDRMWVPGGSYPILSSEQVAGLPTRRGGNIACMFACYGGAFDQPRDCLGEEMLRSPGGPVAVLCNTRVALPYGLGVLGAELFREAFTEQPNTIGQAVLAAKRRSMSGASGGQRLALDSIAKAFYPRGADLEAERAEHLDLFTLLGDPLMRLPTPRTIVVECAGEVFAGERIAVRGHSPIAGRARAELVVRRDRLTFQPQRRQAYDATQLADYSQMHERANDPRLASIDWICPAGPISLELAVPAEARGACHVRVFVEGATSYAAGAADVRIESR